MNEAIMPMKWKNLVSSVIVVGLLLFVFLSQDIEKTEPEPPKTQNAIKPKRQPKATLNREDYEKLYSLFSDGNKDTCIDISYEDAQILMKIAVLEDHTDEVSQAYIMTIILNRLNSDDFPNTIKEVVEQEGQFLQLTDPRYKKAHPDANSHIALALVESGKVKTDYLYYEALYVKNSWASKHRGKPDEYGESRFYK